MKARHAVKTFGLLSTAVFLLVIIAGSSLAAEVKFGKVSLAQVRNNSSKIKTSLENLQKNQTEELSKINTLKREAEKLQEKLKSQSASLSKEEKEKTEAELKDKTQQLQTEEQAAKIKLTFQQKSIQNGVKTQINQAIEKLAKEEGLSAVFLSEMLLYSGGIVDLTDKVTKAIDAMPAIETGAQ
jgi:outer membrane protein